MISTRLYRLISYLIWLFTLAGLLMPGALAVMAPLQQETGTPTATFTLTPIHTSTATLVTQTVQATSTLTSTLSSPTPTATGASSTPSLSPTPAATGSPALTSTPTQTATYTPSSNGQTPTPTLTDTPVMALTQDIPGDLLPSSTATLLPYPTITLVFPEATKTDDLLVAVRPPDSPAKASAAPLWAGLWRFWPLVVLLGVWLLLAAWFFLARRRME